jgi:dolichol kinase
MESYRQEVLRKSLHLSSLWIPIAYLFCTKKEMVAVLIVITIIVLSVDYFKEKNKIVGSMYSKYFTTILRSHEKIGNGNFTGASYMMLAFAVTVIIFPRQIAIEAMLVLIVSDTFAALVGKKFGKHRIGNKSLEGSLAFLISGLLIVSFSNFITNNDSLAYLASFVAVAASTVIELKTEKIRVDDNFSIPLSFAIIKYLLGG